MDDPSVLWRATREPVQDPKWNVYKYEDGAVQFVCDTCQTSIWKGRTVVQEEIKNYMMQAHLTENNTKLLCAASTNHGHEPNYYNIYNVSDKDINNSEIILWVSLSGWSAAQDGPPVEPEVNTQDILDLIELSSVNPTETQDKPVDEYGFDDILNEGILSARQD